VASRRPRSASTNAPPALFTRDVAPWALAPGTIFPDRRDQQSPMSVLAHSTRAKAPIRLPPSANRQLRAGSAPMLRV